MAAHFLAGWTATAEFMAMLGGALCAVLLAALLLGIAMALLAAALGAAFDAVTNALARRWKKTGCRPAGRWAEIIEKGKR